MTSAEFEVYWARNAGLAVEEFRENYVVLVCQCGRPDCLGWAAMLKDQAEVYIHHLPGLYGYRYPAEGESP